MRFTIVDKEENSMYTEPEIPIFRASICYYDSSYREETAEKVLSVLEKYRFFPAEWFHADQLTHDRLIRYTDDQRGLIPSAYSKKDIMGLVLTSGSRQDTEMYWKVGWNFTFYKNSRLGFTPVFKPWNVISLDISHDRILLPGMQTCFLNCAEELIGTVHAFYADIDDVDNSVSLRAAARIDRFSPDEKPAVYWGNYWGSDYIAANHLPGAAILSLPTGKAIDDGVYFTLSDNILDYSSAEVRKIRRRIQKSLK